MSNTVSHYARRALALSAAVLALLFTSVIGPPQGAQAEGWTNYCNNQKLTTPGAAGWLCGGAERMMISTMGMGDQHSVCVWGWANWVQMCTSGPGAWVYNPGNSQWAWQAPAISNNAPGWNIVHGVAWTK
jgi:hypothetical protein